MEEKLGRETKLEIFGSVAAGLADRDSDLELIFFLYIFLTSTRKRKKCAYTWLLLILHATF